MDEPEDMFRLEQEEPTWILDAASKLLRGDEIALTVLSHLREWLTPAEIRKLLNMNVDTYNAARKRISRCIQSLYSQHERDAYNITKINSKPDLKNPRNEVDWTPPNGVYDEVWLSKIPQITCYLLGRWDEPSKLPMDWRFNVKPEGMFLSRTEPFAGSATSYWGLLGSAAGTPARRVNQEQLQRS